MMRKIFNIFILLPILLLKLSALPANSKIDNIALISYKIDNEDKNTTTNKVTLTIAKTTATIEFLTIDPKAPKDTLNSSKYYDSNKFVDMPKATLPDGSEVETPSIVGLRETKTYNQNDLVIVRVTDIDQNIYSDKLDEIVVDIVNPRTNEIERLKLKESSLNSGVFIGYFFVDSCSEDTIDADGVLCIKGGDKIGAKYFDKTATTNVEADAFVNSSEFSLYTLKEASKYSAAVGESIKYTIKVENISNRDYENLKVNDILPRGLKYITNSFKINEKAVEPTISSSGLEISCSYALLKKGESITISYVAVVGATTKSKLRNIAYASADGAIDSNIAEAVVKIKRDFNCNKGYIYGQVYNVSCKESQQKGCGVEGVRVYLEDGRFAKTDKRGRYHFIDVKNGTHVVAVDTQSLDKRYEAKLCNNSVKFANRGSSQFVDIYYGNIARADFCLKELNITKKGLLKNSNLTKSSSSKREIKEQDSIYKEANSLFSIYIKKLSKERVRLYFKVKKIAKNGYINFFSNALKYDKNSIDSQFSVNIDREFLHLKLNGKKEGSIDLILKESKDFNKEIMAILFYDNKKSDTLRVSLDSVNKNLECVTKADDSVDSAKTLAKSKDRKKSFDFGSLDDINSAKIIYPPKGWTPSIPSTRVAIAYPKKGSVELRLNGVKVSMLNYEGVLKPKNRDYRVMHYKGIDLKDGLNIFTAIIKDKNKKVIATLKREIYVENHAPQYISLIKEKSKLIADGKSDVILAFKMLGVSKKPLRGGLVGYYTTDSKHEPKRVVNDRGSYSVGEDGISIIHLKPTVNAGECRVNFKLYDGSEKSFRVWLKPAFKEWIVVGFAEGTIGYKILKDNIKSSKEDKIYTNGRVAFFAKGVIKGEYLLTIAYDSGRKDDDRELFDAIDKDKYYTIYQDASVIGNEAPSVKKLYIKLEKERFSAIFGDIKSDIDGGEYNSYKRSFSGFKAKYLGDNISLVTFIAKSDKSHYIESIKPDGTSGYYYLKHKNIIEGSLRVKLVTRDKDHLDRVLSSEELELYNDFSIDYEDGKISFYNPILSKNEDFNPQYIEIEYDIEGDKAKSYRYGARVAYRSSDDKVNVGINYIKQNGGVQKGELLGVDANIKIDDKISLKAELARSKNSDINGSKAAFAKKLEIEYRDKNSSLKLYYKDVDSSFGLENYSKVEESKKSIGVEVEKKISSKFTLKSSVYKDWFKKESSKSLVAWSMLEYRDKNSSYAIGYKFTKNSDNKSSKLLLEAKKKLLEDRLKLAIEHEQSFNKNSTPTITRALASYRYNSKVTLKGELERKESSSGVKYDARAQIDYKPIKDAKFSLYRVYSKDGAKISIFDTLRYAQSYEFNDFIKLYWSYERGFSQNSNKDSYSSYALGAKYDKNRFNIQTLLEYKSSNSEKKYNAKIGLYYAKSRDLGYAFESDYSKIVKQDSKKEQIDAKLSLAYRVDKELIILDKLEFKKERDSGKNSKTTKFINSLHINYNLDDRWELSFWDGLKYTLDNIDDKEYHSWVNAMGLDLLYKYNEGLAFGVQGALLYSSSADNLEYCYGLYMEKTVSDNSVIRLGVNINGFSDDDFSKQNYTNKGIYLQFRVKFDSSDIKRAIKGLK